MTCREYIADTPTPLTPVAKNSEKAHGRRSYSPTGSVIRSPAPPRHTGGGQPILKAMPPPAADPTTSPGTSDPLLRRQAAHRQTGQQCPDQHGWDIRETI